MRSRRRQPTRSPRPSTSSSRRRIRRRRKRSRRRRPTARKSRSRRKRSRARAWRWRTCCAACTSERRSTDPARWGARRKCVTHRRAWKQDLAPYLAIDTRRSLGQIASVVFPYLAVWTFAAIVRPDPAVAVVLGLVATAFLVRMYSLFHDLTPNSLLASRAANAHFGHLLGFLLFTPYRWWQRQHALHHANTGNLDKRGPGEIYTMTLAEHRSASRLRRLGYRAYRNPVLMLLVGPTLVFLFERRFPQKGMSRRILFSVAITNLALAAWVAGWVAAVGWQTFALVQGTTLVAGGAIAAWMLYIQHQYEDTYYRAADDWEFELAALQGSSYLKLPRALAWVVGN